VPAPVRQRLDRLLAGLAMERGPLDAPAVRDIDDGVRRIGAA